MRNESRKKDEPAFVKTDLLPFFLSFIFPIQEIHAHYRKFGIYIE